MITIALVAAALVAGTVAIHAAGTALVLSHVTRRKAIGPGRLWLTTRLLVEVAWLLLLMHGVEIAVWAMFYLWRGCVPDAETALYFSGVTYTTIGYGDVVLARPWRILGPIEGGTGILMFGLSTGLFFAVLTRVYATPAQPSSS